MNENLERYLDLMFEDHKEDIEAIEKLNDKETDIVFKSLVRKNQKNIKVNGKWKKILYIGNSSFGNLLYKNKKLIIYEK